MVAYRKVRAHCEARSWERPRHVYRLVVGQTAAATAAASDGALRACHVNQSVDAKTDEGEDEEEDDDNDGNDVVSLHDCDCFLLVCFYQTRPPPTGQVGGFLTEQVYFG